MDESRSSVDGHPDQSAALLAAIVDSSDDAIVSKTLDGIITSWNRGAEKLFGYSAAEAVGQSILLIIPEGRRQEEEDVLALLRRGEKIRHFETVRRTKDGRDVHVSLTISPIRNSQGDIIGASKVARDIGEGRRIDELRERLAAIIDSSDDAIVGKTLDGIITSWNRGAEQLFGYTAAEAVGQSIFLIIPQDRIAEEHEVLSRLRRGEKIDHFDTVRRAKDGRPVHISLTVSPIRDRQGYLVGASKVARDIGERVRTEELLRRAHEELEARVRERTAELATANETLRLEMLARERTEQERLQLMTRVILGEENERRRIARDLHDQLGQHLTALRLTLEMLKSQANTRNEARVQIETLEELARQLDRDVAFRVWELRSQELDTLGLRAALESHVRSWSKHVGIPVHYHANDWPDERLTPEFETTVYRLAQEALNNVAKHARADRVDIVLKREPGHLSLIIEDNGKGFDPSTLESAVAHFGLIGMRERAALVGADLQIESTPGGGTCIVVRAPLTTSATNA
jgi:PAS domain S-box-containing protein